MELTDFNKYIKPLNRIIARIVPVVIGIGVVISLEIKDGEVLQSSTFIQLFAGAFIGWVVSPFLFSLAISSVTSVFKEPSEEEEEQEYKENVIILSSVILVVAMILNFVFIIADLFTEEYSQPHQFAVIGLMMFFLVLAFIEVKMKRSIF